MSQKPSTPAPPAHAAPARSARPRLALHSKAIIGLLASVALAAGVVTACVLMGDSTGESEQAPGAGGAVAEDQAQQRAEQLQQLQTQLSTLVAGEQGPMQQARTFRKIAKSAHVYEGPRTGKGMFAWPADSEVITSEAGWRFHPVLETQRCHAGTDIRGAVGVPTYAAADGVVVFAGEEGGYGKIVRVKHARGYETGYAHLNRIGVSVGDRVKRGEQLGDIGQTGRVTGPHLHFEIRRNGHPQQPRYWFDDQITSRGVCE